MAVKGYLVIFFLYDPTFTLNKKNAYDLEPPVLVSFRSNKCFVRLSGLIRQGRRVVWPQVAWLLSDRAWQRN